MYSKKINQLATNLNPQSTDLIPLGDPNTGQLKTITYNQLVQSAGVPTSRTLTINGTTYDLSANRTWTVGTVTSVGLTMPSAFTVSNSPVTGSGTLTVTAAGLASQYIRGDGQLADFPQGGGGGGASVNYYLNGSVSQGTFGGSTYYEMNKTPVIGGGTNFTINADGYIASFITDANDPNLLLIPGGNWNFELKFSASSGGGTPSFYVELYKYNGSTFTLISSGSGTPEVITGGTSIDTYYTTIAVPETALTTTDRLAIRIYVTHQSKTITLYTEDNKLAQIITTFTTGLNALNGLTKQVQYFATGTSGTDFTISSSNDTHTFNFPTASSTNRGLLSSANWSTFNAKQNAITLTTTGSSGPATFVGSTLNIPNYISINDGIESGGVVSYSGTGLVFNVSPCVYYINGVQYTTAATTITLTTADPTNPRIDVIAVNTSNTVVLITGTPSANPVEPQVNPATQLQLTNITVNAGSSTPYIPNELIYDENVESWLKTYTNYNSVDYANTISPYTGTKSILATNSVGNYGGTVRFQPPSSLPVANYTLIKFAVKLSRALTNYESLEVSFLDYTNNYELGSRIKLYGPGYNQPLYGFDYSSTSWQLITVNLASLGITSGKLDLIIFWGNFSLTPAIQIGYDRIELQTINNQLPSSNIAIGSKINNATSGSVLFAGTGGVLSQDNTQFYWDDTNNRLGLGNNTPAYTLDVSGTGRFTGNLTANSLIKSGGTASQILAADGSVITAGTNITISGGTISATDTGITSLNGLTATTQTFATGTSGTDFNISSSTSTHTFNIPTASATNRGALSSSDWSTFNSKQATITLTTTGTSGAATFTSNTLNIPQYQAALTNPVTGIGTTNEIAYWTSSSAIGSLTTATYPSLTELSYVKGVTSAIQTQLNGKEPTLTKGNLTEATSSILTITGGTGAVIGSGTSIQVKQASGSQSGYLSSTDWTTFNNKQAALTNPVTGTGTTNYVARWTSSSALGTGVLYDNATNVGIGTTSPRIALEVIGTDATSSTTSTPNGAIMVSNPTATNSQVMTMGVVNGASNHSWIQSRNSTSANFYSLVLNPSGGNVGIGTTSPSVALDVVGAGKFSSSVTSQANGSTFGTASATGRALIIQAGSGNQVIQFKNAAGGDGTLFVEGTSTTANYRFDTYSTSNALYIANDGKIGIGTSSPSDKLHVYSSSSPSQSIQDASGVLRILTSGGQNYIQSGIALSAGSAANLIFGTIYGNNEWMRLTSIGRLLIGTTTDVGNTVHIQGDICVSGASGSSALLSRNTVNTTKYGWFNAGNGTFVLTNSGVANVGSFNMSTGAYTSTSDFNKKKDIELSTLGLNEVLQLIPKTYRFKTQSDTENKNIGFIAQDVKDIIPYAYQESKSGDETFIGLQYDSFIPVLVKAIQELKAEIDILKNK